MAIFSLTKKADYGLSLLAHLSEKGRGGRVSLAEMEKRGMPRPFMAQIANSLVVAGILNSKEGRGGWLCPQLRPEYYPSQRSAGSHRRQ